MSPVSDDQLPDLLAGWLPTQRWFGAKGRTVSAVSILSDFPVLTREEGAVRLLVLRVGLVDGEPDLYQLLLGSWAGELPDRLTHATIGESDGTVYYDGSYDREATEVLLTHLSTGTDLGDLHVTNAGEVQTGLPSRVLGTEQSNTSLVFGDVSILKTFRRLQPGANPDVEVTRALADAGSTHIACPLGWYEAEVDGELTTLGLLQVFLKGASDGWAMATASVRDLFAEADLHADEVGGDFAAESERLGQATAEVHLLLKQSLASRTAGPTESADTARQLHQRLDAALAVVPDLAPFADALRRSYDEVAALTEPVPVQRVHGDYHLGQVLRTQEGWVLLDFEGEPARPLAERTALMSPLRDVAGMLRSYDYAARHLLAERGGDSQLAYRATEWAERNRQAFCDGYARAAGADPRDQRVLLRAFELDKAVYEVVYEARNRPTWLAIPVGSIERLASS